MKIDAVKGSTCPAFQTAALLREASFPPVSDRRKGKSSPVGTFKRDGQKAGNKIRMEQSTDP
ncbi:MAG: hypothetical protein LBF89_12945 [Bacteroidales bacterium]|nr:hypothetical protein [Bacteroidales bacterium]